MKCKWLTSLKASPIFFSCRSFAKSLNFCLTSRVRFSSIALLQVDDVHLQVDDVLFQIDEVFWHYPLPIFGLVGSGLTWECILEICDSTCEKGPLT